MQIVKLKICKNVQKSLITLGFLHIYCVHLYQIIVIYKVLILGVMLVQFSFGNYKCFKDENCLSILAPGGKAYSNYSIKTPFRYSVVKTVPIYGANASGKSKVLEAFKFMKCVICPPMRKGCLLYTSPSPRD